MTDREALLRLAEIVGEGGLEEHAPVEIDGARLAATLRPGDGDALARVVTALGEGGLAAVVRGGGSELALGNPPRGAGLFLSTERLAGVDELDEVEGVCHAAAGTPLAALHAALEGSAWELPLDAPGEGATLGGCLAAARVGPRCLGFGLPRDVLLGLEVTLGSGERTRCGGRVVKNVTGYDLGKLYTGSLGSLGVIEGAWLRLLPRPERVRVLDLALPDLASGCRVGLAAARRASARAALVLGADGAEAPADDAEGVRLLVELAGADAAVAGDLAWLEGEHGARPAGEGALEAASRELVREQEGLRFRVSARASRLAEAACALRRAGARLAVQPGLGILHARFAAAPDAAVRAWSAVSAAARAAGGAARLESAPLAAKRERDVFDGDPALLPLTRALKERFDPRGVLNPGRFMGRL